MLDCEQRRLFLRRIPLAFGWILIGVVLTITVGQYQGSIEMRFGDGYLRVEGEPRCELADK